MKERFIEKYGARFHLDETGQKERYVFATAFENKWDHAFQVPRDEFDDLLLRTAEARGGEVCLSAPVVRVNRTATRITSVTICNHGVEQDITGSDFISTMAIRDFVNALEPPPPTDVLNAAKGLKYRDFLTVVLILDAPNLFPDNWLYIHTPRVHVGRIQNYKNWSQAMLPDSTKTSLGMEYFVNEGDELWSMPDAQLIELAKRELELIGLARADLVIDGTVKRMLKAYPVYDPTYREKVGIVRGYLDAFDNFQTVGRNGMHKYNNQDHSMYTAMLSVDFDDSITARDVEALVAEIEVEAAQRFPIVQRLYIRPRSPLDRPD